MEGMLMTPNRRSAIRLVLVSCVSLTVVFGYIYSIYLGSSLRFVEERYNFALASNLGKLQGYTLDSVHATAMRPVGYPAFLAIGVFLGAGISTLRFVNFCLLAINILLVYNLARMHGSPRAGLLAACLVPFYPVLYYTAGTLYAQTIASTLFLGILVLTTGSEGSWLRSMWSGILTGYLLLTVPTFLIVVAVMWVVLFVLRPGCRRQLLLASVLPVVLIVSLWTLRNYLVLGRFVPVATNAGVNLLLGNTETTAPNAGTTIDTETYQRNAALLNEVEADKYLTHEATRFIRENPLRALKLYLLKLVNYFNYRNEIATPGESSYLKDLVMLLTYGPLLSLFCVRLAFAYRCHLSRFESLCLLLYLSHAVFLAVFVTRVRYRLPFDYLLIVVDAMFVSSISRVIGRAGSVHLRSTSYQTE